MLDSLPRRRLLLATVAVLVVGAIVAAALVVTQRDDDKPPPIAQGKLGPVIVLPGYGGRLTSLIPIVVALRAEGRQAVVFTPTQAETGDLRVQAQLLGALVTRTLRTSGATSVDVVGYSAGGVIARIWVKDFGGAAVARRVLTIASPHHGTSQTNIRLESPTRACPMTCEQLSTGSPFLTQLNSGDETPAGPAWITIRSATDGIVTPDSSATLKGALNLLVQTGCPAATTIHTAMPADPYVLAALGSTLGTAPPKAPTDARC